MAFTFRTAADGAGGSQTCNNPGISGDLVVAAVWSATSGVTGPTGWLRTGLEHQYDAFFVSLWFLVAGGAEPASYTWGGTANSEISIAAFPGPRASPEANAAVYQTQGPTTTPATPTINVTVTDALLIAHFAATGSPAFTPPAGMTEWRDLNGISAYYQIIAGAGPGTTSKTATASVSDTFGAGIAAFQPGTVVSPLPAGATAARMASAAANASRSSGGAAATAARSAGTVGASAR